MVSKVLFSSRAKKFEIGILKSVTALEINKGMRDSFCPHNVDYMIPKP